MAASFIGQPGAFDAAKESWTQFSEHVAYFFQANGITEQTKKKATLLAIIGPSAYKLLRSLVAPTKPDEAPWRSSCHGEAPQPCSFGNHTKIPI